MLAILALMGCIPTPADQEAMRYVAAVEIPIEDTQERIELTNLLTSEAGNHDGLHVDDVSDQSADFYKDSRVLEPDQRPTVSITIWRGEDDDQQVGSVSDVMHRGRVWATFLKGPDPKLETPFREAALNRILARWPQTNKLPILPTGGLPLARDLIMTDQGYRIDRSQAETYGLAKDSELLVAN
ncbi:hypothetical protein [Altererythrobacter lutimaris]|nr:hypothetical protein [Altererythrobacter lutimaris]